MKTKIALTTLMLALLILAPAAIAQERTIEIDGSATVVEDYRGYAVLVAESDGRSEGGEFAAGEILEANQTILEGSFSNQSGTAIQVASAGGRVSVLEAGDIGVIAADGLKCSVSCGAGYFACCQDNTIMIDKCICKPNGSSASSCTHGGVGATSCSLGSG